MSEQIYLSSPDVTEAEEEAVLRAIRSGWVAPLGPEVDAFEAELADFCGREHAVALSSGTAALHLGLLILGVGPGDLVATSTMTFAATANAITYTGAEPLFVDCDETGNLDPALLDKAFGEVAGSVRRIAAVVPVDLFGKVADHPAIAAVADAHGVPVLSDAAESLGAVRDGLSSAAYGLAAAVSFNGNKVMTTSGGGALLTDDAGIAERARYLATQARQPVVHYEHTDIGYNYRLSNILAALGRAQLARLPEMIERRRGHRLAYRELFAGVPGVTVFGEPSGADGPGGGTRDNFWLTSVLVEPAVAGFAAEDLRLALAADNIEARPLWKPMHLQPVFAGVRSVLNGTSERLFEVGLSLPSGSALTELEVGRVHSAIGSFLEVRRAAV
ncbi:DegT/DnrJ/EryC1/StrS family aminotransferase [Intrasporangium calvum]|uniref:DegT/DnrJ/EryC1/StrS aminotransferase n=1 Tax=Intrasporangium calvum (strain ATCC 23552 / DSM 43043 / JCM 3097 / NBRC 12989 / NCIMB 10167 / NRRL B-3866 / 7 KIP) TaxID=710696 RepID=E6S8I6_INTC7|nr:aminotransferase class I/II-fold pyridoxal phosphate-dependent enzyme [Intrasporangium calvum]ADU49148.1 DegT/DnrJ/EryC1/StrS aminotransferase [Intrasporangium calvum DSM 43043]